MCTPAQVEMVIRSLAKKAFIAHALLLFLRKSLPFSLTHFDIFDNSYVLVHVAFISILFSKTGKPSTRRFFSMRLVVGLQ